MARYQKLRGLAWSTPGQTAWRAIHDALANGSPSVEVVMLDPNADPPMIEVRAWSAVRKDGSNEPAASATVSY